MAMWHPVFYFTVTIVTVYGEVITLLGKHNITCVLTANSVNSTVYLDPPVESSLVSDSPVVAKWEGDHEWKEESSTHVSFAPVTDKRWTGFDVRHEEDGLRLTDYISFSILMLEEMVLSVMDKRNEKEKKLRYYIENKENGRRLRWFHYSIAKQNKRVRLLSENGEPLKEDSLEFDPHWVYFEKASSNRTFWKLHKYDFRAARTVSKENASVDISSTGNLCLSMYVSVDQDCLLDLDLEINGASASRRVTGFNQPHSPKNWERVVLEVDRPGKGRLSFFRSRQHRGESTGFWAIGDLSHCDRNIDIYRTNLKENGAEHICRTLGDNYTSHNDDLHRPTCEGGFFGPSCNISCESVLGKEHPRCEGQKICQSASSCYCSPGYQGKYCEEQCPSGNWGLSCRNECRPRCENCHFSSGKCLNVSNLPTKLALISNNVRIYVPALKPISYVIRYQCVSEWCKGEIVERDTFDYEPDIHTSNVVVRKFRNMKPFTTYRPIVSVVNDNFSETYGLFAREVGSSSEFQNVKIYCRNSSTLWVKFQIPDISNANLSQYRIWYSSERGAPNSVTNVARSKIWDSYLCGRIEGLERNTSYNIAIEDARYEQGGLSGIEKGFTAEEASRSPENLEVTSASEHRAVVQWDHPSVTNGPLRKFIIEVSNGSKTENYTYNVVEPQKTYSYSIPIVYYSQYQIRVRGLNAYEGEESAIKAFFAPSNSELSSNALVETCVATCKLLIPKPDGLEKFNYRFFIKGNDTDQELAVKVNNYSENYFEIGTTDEFFLDKKAHFMFLELSDSEKNRKVYIVTEENEVFMTETKITIILITIILTILSISLIILLVLYKTKVRCFRKRRRFDLAERSLPERRGLILERRSKRNFTKIALSHFEQYLKSAVQCEDLVKDLESLPLSTRPALHAFQEKNRNRNRNMHDVPYDHSRVILNSMVGMGHDDYINASYINSFFHPKAYIATQGPKFSTIRDFWRMVWQQNVKTIIMATNFIENKQRKCAEYFPQRVDTIVDCGAMTIKLIKEEFYEYYDKRLLEIHYKKFSRTVYHFHLKWNPDNKVPLYTDCVVPLIKVMSEQRERNSSPIVVHCNTGSDRTGTLILCQLTLEMAKIEKCVDFYSVLKHIRDQRPNMISSEKQYVLAHLIVFECLMEQENIFKRILTDNVDSELLKLQLKCVKKLCQYDRIVRSWTADENLTEPDVALNLVDGYGKTAKYVVGQQPTKSSIFDFWITVIGKNIQTVVFLDKVTHEISPQESRSPETIFKVKELKSSRKKYGTVKTLLLLAIQASSQQVTFEHEIIYFQTNDRTPFNGGDLVDILNYVHNNSDPTGLILVACRDGITKCGVFVTLSYLMEKLQKELTFDVCGAIRTVRRNGTDFIQNEAQLAFLYNVLSENIEKIDSYSFPPN